MSSIAIITDTDSSIPFALSNQYHIKQVPITVHFGEESFRAVYDIDDQQVFERINKENKLPTTSAPSPGQFVETFRQALDEGAETILCFTVSGEVSATYKAALTAKEEFPEADIEVIDTRNLCIAQGYMVLAAAESIQNGATKEEAIEAALDLQDRVYLFGALPTLKYIAMSGRVGQLTAGIANILDIQPILTIQNGKLELLEKVRTRGKAWKRVVELSVEAADGRPLERLAILNVASLDSARQFETQLCQEVTCQQNSLLVELTPGLSVHSGAGLVGACFVAAKA